MGWVTWAVQLVMDLLAKIGIGVVNEQLKTPAETTNVEKSEGTANNPDGNYFAERNRVPDNRDEAKK